MKLSKILSNKTAIIAIMLILSIILLCIYKLEVLSKPPELYVKTSNSLGVKCIKGGFNWNYFGRHEVADALTPSQMQYTEENTIYVNPNQSLTFTNSSNYKMYNEDIRYYDENLKEQIITTNLSSANIEAKIVSYNAPRQLGTYIFSVTMNYYNKGSVQYGVKVVVTYDVSSLEQYVNTYAGDHLKVYAILNLLPYSNYKKDIELITSKEPYGIIINYSNLYVSKSELEFNTLALFTLIQNVDNITYNIQNNESIKTFNLTRDEIKQKYDLTIEGLKEYISENNKNKYGYIILEKLSQNYTIENAIADKCFVTNLQKDYNMEVLENFISKVRNKEATFIRIVSSTIEGDVIIRDVKYLDNIFTLTTDNTRDKFAAKSDKQYEIHTYNNINIANGSNGDISIVALYNGNGEMYQSQDVYGIYINSSYVTTSLNNNKG